MKKLFVIFAVLLCFGIKVQAQDLWPELEGNVGANPMNFTEVSFSNTYNSTTRVFNPTVHIASSGVILVNVTVTGYSDYYDDTVDPNFDARNTVIAYNPGNFIATNTDYSLFDSSYNNTAITVPASTVRIVYTFSVVDYDNQYSDYSAYAYTVLPY